MPDDRDHPQRRQGMPLVDLHAAFRAKVAPRLAGIEAERLAALANRNRRLWIGVPAAALALAGSVVLMQANQWTWKLPLFTALLSGVGAWYWADMPVKAYESKLKAWLLGIIASALDRFSYSAAPAAFDIASFDSAHLLPGYMTATAHDQFTGHHRGCAFAMVHAHLRTRSGGRSWKTVFEGLLVQISVPQAARGRIIIVRDRGRLGNALSALFKPGQRVEIPDPAFETRYEVYADDAAEALEFVSSPFVENFTALSAATGADDIVAAFVGPRFLLAANGVPAFAHDLTVHTPPARLDITLQAVADRVAVVFRIIDRLHGLD